MMTTKIRRDVWNIYRTTGYTHDVAQDQRSAGGVHHHEVRRTKTGWQTRICQSNGRHTAYGPTKPVSDEEGERSFTLAVNLS